MFEFDLLSLIVVVFRVNLECMNVLVLSIYAKDIKSSVFAKSVYKPYNQSTVKMQVDPDQVVSTFSLTKCIRALELSLDEFQVDGTFYPVGVELITRVEKERVKKLLTARLEFLISGGESSGAASVSRVRTVASGFGTGAASGFGADTVVSVPGTTSTVASPAVILQEVMGPLCAICAIAIRSRRACDGESTSSSRNCSQDRPVSYWKYWGPSKTH